jgi:hypothetical protein
MFAAYRKDCEIYQKKRKKWNDQQDEHWHVAEEHRDCVRIEVRLDKVKATNITLDDPTAYEAGMRLKSFTIKDVFRSYEKVLKRFKCVFSSDYQKPKAFAVRTEELIIELMKLPSLPPLGEFLDEVQARFSYTDSSMRVIRANLERWLESTSTLNLDELLPFSGVSSPMNIVPLKKNDRGELVPVFREPHSPLKVDPRIAEAYSKMTTLDIHDLSDPDPMQPWLWNES